MPEVRTENAGKRDLYEVLGVARDAGADEIRKVYRKLARRHHPDVNPGDAAAEEAFKAVSQAHAVLSDVDRRRDYDEFGDRVKAALAAMPTGRCPYPDGVTPNSPRGEIVFE